MANSIFNRGLSILGNYDWAADTTDIGVLLVTSAYVFDKDAGNVVSDVVGNETSGTGYIRKGVAGANRTNNEDDPGDAANLRISDASVVWTNINAGINLEIILFFVDGGSLTASDTHNLLGHIDTGTNIPIISNGGTVTLNFSTDGAVKLA